MLNFMLYRFKNELQAHGTTRIPLELMDLGA